DLRRDVGEKFSGVDKHGVPAGRRLDRDSTIQQSLSQILHLMDAGSEKFLVDSLLQSARQRLQIPAGQTAVGGEAFVGDRHGTGLFVQFLLVLVEGQNPSDVDQ